MYVILIAESASCRKSVAMELGLKILETNEEVKIVHERTTLEGLVDVMNRAQVSPTGAIQPDGSITIHADELSNLFGKASYITDLVSFLTSAYTSKSGTMDFLTRNKGWAKVTDPCPNVIAGTTPEQFGEIFPSMTLSSGFMGRILLIVGRKGERIAKPQLKISMRQDLADDLYQMGRLEGEVKLTDEVEEMFKEWYESMSGPASPELSSFHERKHDHVLKTAMLLSISESDELVITKEHFEIARDQVEHIVLNFPRAVAFIGATEKSNIGDTIVRMIRGNSPIPLSRSIILRRIYKRIQDKDEFEAIMETLEETNRINKVVSGRRVDYVLKDD